MSKNDRQLRILMNGILVGALRKTRRGDLTFTYDEQWLITPGARPISLSLPLTGTEYTGDLVYNFFDNLLPDSPQIRSIIQAKFQAQSSHPFDLLDKIGKDCVGAIQVLNSELTELKHEIHAKPLSTKEIANILRSYQNNPLGMIDVDSDFRISLAGVQEKTALLYMKKRWHRPLRNTPTSHIFKLPIGVLGQRDLTDSCENEWLCAQITRAFGLPIANSEIMRFEDLKVLVVERFDRRISQDRTWLMRIPQEDICQALSSSPNLKYESDGGPGIQKIMRLLLGSTRPSEDRDFFFKSQILFWLLAATDGHAKNFSIFIGPGGIYHLTPLYDVISTYPLIAARQLQSQKTKMAMALYGKRKHYNWHNVQRRYFIETAKAVDYPSDRAEKFLDEMLEQIDVIIQQVSKKLSSNFPTKVSQPIFLTLRHFEHKTLINLKIIFLLGTTYFTSMSRCFYSKVFVNSFCF